MKAKKNGECEGCGNPGIMANVTRVRYERGQVVQCELCHPDLANEADEADPDALHTIRARIIGQRFAKPDGSFFIYMVELDGAQDQSQSLPDGVKKPFGATGPIGQLDRGDVVVLTGRFVVNAKFGFQMEVVSQAQLAIKECEMGLVAFLSKFPFIGRFRAQDAIKRFGGWQGVIEVLDNAPERMAEINGITPERAVEIKEAYDKAAGFREFRQFASKLGLGEIIIAAAIEEWGDDAQAVIEADPFELMELPRGSFKLANEVHTKLQRDPKHPSRCAAGVLVALGLACDEGHTYALDEELRGDGRGRAAEEIRRLGLNAEEVEDGLKLLEKEHTRQRKGKTAQVPPKVVRTANRVYLREVYFAEMVIVKELARLRTARLKEVPVPTNAWGDRSPAPEQVDALRLACEKPVIIITGGPGCIDATTKLLFETEGRRSKGGREYSVEDAYHKFHRIPRKGKGGTKFWRGRCWTLSMREDGGINYNEVKNIVYNGIKQVYEVTSRSGRRLLVTMEHPFKVPMGTPGADEEGFKRLEDLRVGDTVVVRREEATSNVTEGRNRTHRREVHVPYHPHARWKTVTATTNRTTGEMTDYAYKLVREYRLVVEAELNRMTLNAFVSRLQSSDTTIGLRFLPKGQDVHHENEDPADNDVNNLKVVSKSAHGRVHGYEHRRHFGNQCSEEDVIELVRLVGERPVYDLVMADPHRNYVAGGFVVHNCGKTFTTNTILNVLEAAGHQLVLCAPTGKAAKRMTEMTGREASTIHRLTSSNLQIEGSVVCVDEASMIDTELMAKLLSAVRTGTRLIIVGDVDQLPSIGPGRVLFDFIEAGMLPVVRLTRIFRQQSDGLTKRIPDVARAINEGKTPDLGLKGTDVTFLPFEDPERIRQKIVMAVTEQLPAKLGLTPEQIQVIAPQRGEENKANWPIGVRALNIALQEALNPSLGAGSEVHAGEGYRVRPNDRVIHTRNNYDLITMNGELGTVVRVDVRPFIPPADVITSFRTKRAKEMGACPVCGGKGSTSGLENATPLSYFKQGQRTGLESATLTPCGACIKRQTSEKASTLMVIDYGDRRVGYTKDECREVQLAYALTCHKCVDPMTLVETPKGLQRIKDITNSGQIATPTGRAGYLNKITNPSGARLRIKTRGGYELSMTPDHGIDVLRDAEYQRVEACQISVGDIVRLRLGSTYNVSSFVKLPPEPVALDVRASVHVVPAKLGNNVAEFLGLMVANGTVGFTGFRFSNEHKDVVDRFKFLCTTLFRVDAQDLSLDCRAYGAAVLSVQLAAWLLSIEGLQPHKKAVPPQVLRSSKAIQASFLRGLFENGTVNMNKRLGRLDHIELALTGDQLVNDVRVMLLRFGIITGSGKKNQIYLHGTQAVKLVNQVIGVISAWKKGRLALPPGRETQSWIPLRCEELETLAAYHGGRGWLTRTERNTLSTGRMLRRVALEMLARVDRRSGAEELYTRICARLDWAHEEVKWIRTETGESMCVEVPKGHQFLQNGFSGWNCQGSQCKAVVFPVHDVNQYMLTQPLVYTAITRAEQYVLLIGQESRMAKAVKNRRGVERRTSLRERLTSMEPAT